MARTQFNSKRTTEPTPKKVIYSINDEPLIISKALMDLFLKEKNHSNLLALYSYYYYTAKWQKTDQPKATTEYIANKLGWCIARVIKTKKKLTKFGLVEDVIKKDSYGRIIGYYIKLNFIFTSLSVLPSQEKIEGYSLKPNRRKKEINISPAKNRTKEYLPLAQYLSEIIHTKKNIDHTPSQINAWAEDIRKLVEGNKVPYERIDKALQWYEKNIGGSFIPVIESGYSLKNKFSKLEDAMGRKDYSLLSISKQITREGEIWFLRNDGKYYNRKGILYR